ncbi:MAG: M14 family zinc carboxypeptidase [archaeon GB-1867-035]|nr:M14 family zinc carboxypeptidase [Candidatus Culexmicrobium profundum]
MENLFNKILSQIPDYKEFLTVDELNNSSKKLAKQYPEKAALMEIGKARNNESIYCLRIGDGRLKALLFAFPHPNEPIGSMTLEYLSWKLVKDDEFRNRMNTTWYIIKCIDPFGARLNEGWFKGEWTPKKYVLNYYRPPGYNQVEWTFPIEYKTLKFNNPVPETKALMEIISEIKPDFIASLHNAGFCGAYFYLSNPIPEIYNKLHEISNIFKIPIHMGEPETPYIVKFADAIFKMPSVTETYEYIAKHTGKDPAKIIKHGASSDEYAKRVNKNVLTIVCEVPYIYDDRISNTTKIGVKRRDIILLGLNFQKKQLKKLSKKLRQVEPYINKESPFYEALSEFIRVGEEYSKVEEKWAKTSPETDRQATVAEAFDAAGAVIHFYAMLRLGLFYRLIKEKVDEEKKLKRCYKWILKEIDLQEREFKKLAEYKVIPIRNLVGVQLGAILYGIWSKIKT